MRLPRDTFVALSGIDHHAMKCGQFVKLAGRGKVGIGHGLLGSSEVFAVEALMGRKLGLAEALLEGALTGWAVAVCVAMDDVPDPLGTGLFERTMLITYAVTLTSGSMLIPPSSVAYSRLMWTQAAMIGRALRARDALLIDDTLNPFEVCIDGLCVKSAALLTDC